MKTVYTLVYSNGVSDIGGAFSHRVAICGMFINAKEAEKAKNAFAKRKRGGKYLAVEEYKFYESAEQFMSDFEFMSDFFGP